MATFGKINDWVLNLHKGVDFDTDTLKLAFSNTAPASETTNPTSDGNGVLANVTQISYTNWTDDLTTDRTLTGANVSISQTSGTFTLDYTADITITASGGSIASWRYFYLYDDTPISPADPLICYWDHGAAISLASGDSATIAFNASGIYTLA